ncbi:MAG: hypothetical protein H7062_06875 [Candidatus Saccharimonas sp.]|nr:hypothetical protein [Planctomycetaceae bacterium]
MRRKCGRILALASLFHNASRAVVTLERCSSRRYTPARHQLPAITAEG